MIRELFRVAVVVGSLLNDKITAFVVQPSRTSLHAVPSSPSCQQQRRPSSSLLKTTFWWDSLPNSSRYNNKKQIKQKLEKVIKESKSSMEEANAALEEAKSFMLTMEEEEEKKDSNWALYTVPKLKSELKDRNLKVTGKKVDLVARLEEYEKEELSKNVVVLEDNEKDVVQKTMEASLEEVISTASSSVSDDTSYHQVSYSDMTVAELKAELRTMGLKVGGKKADLVERLQQQSQDHDENDNTIVAHDTSSSSKEEEEAPPPQPVSNNSSVNGMEMEERTVAELKNELRTLGLKVSGNKALLIERLKAKLVT